MTYVKNLLIAVDQFVNAVLCGWPDETLSSRSWRWKIDGISSIPNDIVNFLFFWEKEHCKNSYESERTGRQLPPELRKTDPNN